MAVFVWKGRTLAGEAQTGVMGANRLAGNALTETQVFGAIAGTMAVASTQTSEAGVPITGGESATPSPTCNFPVPPPAGA